ncbi:hypothetical protein B0H63DRAFT_515976 [Podospora didyma]|uniref:Protein kinase domain-containing protein n=1 Tax=Podospora didyma TaxID=330526 RepID=A0AAE0P3J7_9PEZI|nr:hypothetical protein B0H63DRAFT_515976 [Podospora didyma]
MQNFPEIGPPWARWAPTNWGSRQHTPTAKAAALRYSRILAPLGFTYKRILGWGGNGMALLYSWQGQYGKLDVAIKVQLRGSDLTKERRSMMDICGTRHTVDVYDLPNEEEAIRIAREQVNENLDPRRMILMQYFPRGNIGMALQKVGDALPINEKKIPNRLLWQIFDCLYKMCIAMAFDQKSRPEVQAVTDPRLGDCGAMEGFTPRALRDPMFMWSTRLRGKTGFIPSEQFTEEWDYIPRVPLEMNPPAQVAGKYSWKTNLYQMGCIMGNLITTCMTFLPPKPTIIQNQRGTVRCTYGGYLLYPAYDWVDDALIGLVVACMNENPDHRPDFSALTRIIEQNVTAAWDDASWAEVVKFTDIMFKDPKPVPITNPANWENWLKDQLADLRADLFPEHYSEQKREEAAKLASQQKGQAVAAQRQQRWQQRPPGQPALPGGLRPQAQP